MKPPVAAALAFQVALTEPLASPGAALGEVLANALIHANYFGRSGLEVKRLREEKQDLLEALEMYVKVFFLGLDSEDGESDGGGVTNE